MSLKFKMPLDLPMLRVGAQKKVRQHGSGNKSQITVVSCGSATGHVIATTLCNIQEIFKPLVVWTWIPIAPCMDLVPWMDWYWTIPALVYWPLFWHAPAVHPLLLLMDGHSTHYKPEVIRLKRKAAETRVRRKKGKSEARVLKAAERCASKARKGERTRREDTPKKRWFCE